MQRTLWTMHPDEAAVFDRNAVALGLPIIELMQAAAAALAAAAAEMLGPPSCLRGPICFLCGPGNNGGDGYAAALILQKQGYRVEIIASTTRQRSDESQYFRQKCLEQLDIMHYIVNETEKIEEQLSRYTLLVDCLLGVGFSGTSLRGPIAKLLELCQKQALPPVLACDIPSGLIPSNAGSMTLPATRTLTFHAPKLTMYCGTELCTEVGKLQIAPLPWPAETTDCGLGEILRLPPLRSEARKGDRGRLLVVGGGPYYGAPLLAAQAAGRSGCDLIHLAMPHPGRGHWPLYLIPEQFPTSRGFFDESCYHYLQQRCEKIHFDAILLGPGLGRHPETIDAIWNLLLYLMERNIPLVVDADALYILAQRSPGSWPQSGWKAMRGIVTPHRGELRRWLGKNSPSQVLTLENGVRDSEEQVILCSGSTDELIGPGGRFALANDGHPRMACAGTGDLLAGLCVSFLGQGMNPWPAARLAAYILRQAGSLAGKEMGIGLVADDLPPYIGQALQHHMRA